MDNKQKKKNQKLINMQIFLRPKNEKIKKKKSIKSK